MDWSLPGSSVHGILQARVLEWVAIPFSRGSFQPRDQTQVSVLQADSSPSEPPGKPKVLLGSGGIQTHSSKEPGALLQCLRPLSYTTQLRNRPRAKMVKQEGKKEVRGLEAIWG